MQEEGNVSAEIIRRQIEESKGYLHEVGNAEISNHVKLNAKERR
jgi:hypothetical protein